MAPRIVLFGASLASCAPYRVIQEIEAALRHPHRIGPSVRQALEFFAPARTEEEIDPILASDGWIVRDDLVGVYIRHRVLTSTLPCSIAATALGYAHFRKADGGLVYGVLRKVRFGDSRGRSGGYGP